MDFLKQNQMKQKSVNKGGSENLLFKNMTIKKLIFFVGVNYQRGCESYFKKIKNIPWEYSPLRRFISKEPKNVSWEYSSLEEFLMKF